MNAGQVVRRVLAAAAKTDGFFDLCDAERLEWMIERGFMLGRQASRGKARKSLPAGALLHCDRCRRSRRDDDEES
jgi:hypothetical protein